MIRAAAVCCWLLAWWFAALAGASFFAARNGKQDIALTELVVGVFGAAGLAWAGAVLW